MARLLLSFCLILGPAVAFARVVTKGPVGVIPIHTGPAFGKLATPSLTTTLPSLSMPSLTSSALPTLTPLLPSTILPIQQAVAPQETVKRAKPRVLNPVLGGLETLTETLQKNSRAPSPAQGIRTLMKFFSGADLSLVNAAAPPENPIDAFANKIISALLRHGGDPIAAEPEILQLIAGASASGQLEPGLRLLLDDPRIADHLPVMDAAKKDAYAHRLSKIVAAELAGAGLTPGSNPFEEWEARGARQMEAVRRSEFAPRGPGEPSLFEEEGFIEEMQRLTGVSFSDDNKIEILSSGEASYAARNDLIANAKQSINLMAWAVYDDKAGRETVDLLIAKHKQGVKVRVMVDGQTVDDSGHGRIEIARLEEAGIDVIRFLDPERPYDGLHSKMLLVDGRVAIAGGRNVGDPYLHTDPEGEKWRDMDVRLEGPSVDDSEALFADVWNGQVRDQKLPHDRVEDVLDYTGDYPGQARIAISYQQPGEPASVLLGMLKAISGASTRINIENAYFISFPAIRSALLEAIERGVEVNILTNSAESVDQPIVVVPILESLPELIEAGANVYIMRDTMLHAKFMTVDGIYSNVTSYNIHPRSERYEHEMAVAGLDAQLAADLDDDFARDIHSARKIESAGDLDIPSSPLSTIVRRYLFNQL